MAYDIEEAQALLDAGYSRTATASKLGVHHSIITRAVRLGKLEVYQTFEEVHGEDEAHLYMNFDWLYEEDKLDEIFRSIVMECAVYLPKPNERTEDDSVVSKYCKEVYRDLFGYLESKDALIVQDLVFFYCTSCEQFKSLNEATRNAGSYMGIDCRCKDCLYDFKRGWYHVNKEKADEAVKKWQLQNKNKLAAYYHNRVARARKLPADLTEEQIGELFEVFGGCALTGSEDVHLDHVIPLKIGHGGTTFSNIVPLRADLNLSKNDNNIFEWFKRNRQRFELSQEKFDRLIKWLALLNGMSVVQYEIYVYKCFANPR